MYVCMCQWVCMPRAKRGLSVSFYHFTSISLRQALSELNPSDPPDCPAGATGMCRMLRKCRDLNSSSHDYAASILTGWGISPVLLPHLSFSILIQGLMFCRWPWVCCVNKEGDFGLPTLLLPHPNTGIMDMCHQVSCMWCRGPGSWTQCMPGNQVFSVWFSRENLGIKIWDSCCL